MKPWLYTDGLSLCFETFCGSQLPSGSSFADQLSARSTNNVLRDGLYSATSTNPTISSNNNLRTYGT